ncbi:MAG TPA: NF038122 family metalloprotease [Rhizomicrobium sp.]|nr:NF038122 family metalloprotease [Rhizomicrobium sp.]
MSDLGFSASPFGGSLDFAHDFLGQNSSHPWSLKDWLGEFRAGFGGSLPFLQPGLTAPTQAGFAAPQIAGIISPPTGMESFTPPSTTQSGMTINVSFDSSTSTAPAGFTTAVNAAVAYLESQFTDPITINIHVGWGEVNGSAISSGALGESSTNLIGVTYAQIKTAMTNDAKTGDDSTALASLAATDPTGGGTFIITVAEARSLGLYTASDSQIDGYVGFDKTAPWDYDNSNGVTSGSYDFYDVVLHEISEVMGRQTANGGSSQYEPLDLFHYSGSGVRDFSGTTAGYFSIDGGVTHLKDFSTDTGGDFGDWANSAGNDAFLAFSGPGVVNAISEADLKELDILGYDRVGSSGTPNLTANSLSFSNTTLSFHINNTGTGSAAASTAGIYLSTDSTITTADTRINTHSTPSLAAGATDVESVVLALPNNLTPGTYYIGVIADYSNVVTESSETDNASTATPIILGDLNANTLTGTTGTDKIFGLDGNDTIVMGANLTSADQIDGGTGTDTVTLNGNYAAGVTFSATTMVNVETISLSAGHSYNLTTNNANVAAGQSLKINGSALGASDVLTFNGAAESNGTFTINDGAGNDVLTGGAGADIFILQKGGNDIAHGGAGNDAFNVYATLNAADQIDGGTGTDSVNLKGDYSGGLVLGATTITNVETLTFTAGFSYNLTENNANVASGQTLTVNASSLGAANTLTFNGAAETDGKFTFTGGAGNDVLTGGAGADVFNLQNGGNDVVQGGAGNDTFNMTAAFTAADQIDGGAGTDVVSLNGDYSLGVTFLATTMVNVETINLSTGHSYNLTTNDATVAAGQVLKINGAALGASNVLTFNGAAETNGQFTIYDGAGNDVLTGGANNDTFNMQKGGNDIVHGGAGNDSISMYGMLTAADQIDGGTGTDNVILNGNYSGGLALGASTITNVETLTFTAGFSYNLTENNANVASGQTLTVNGSSLGVSDSLTFNGAAETDGKFLFKSGLGADHFTGGGGADTFLYASASQSTSTHYDTISGFNFSADKFDVTGTITGIDAALTTGALNTASFDSDLTTAMNGHLLAHHAELFTANSGTLSGQTFLVVDINGTAGYQTGADLVFHMTSTTGTLATTDFI